ncbi:MAG TPA: hypothetical protein VNV64_03410, partial [Candidatus Binatia bacterium]|nr:hypothetical protein [Candidatus Binatia bacterium]
GYMRLFEKDTPKTRTNPQNSGRMSRLLRWRIEDAALVVHLDYSAGVVQHSDNCALRARIRAILRVCDRITDRIRPCVPDRPVSKQLIN